MSVQVAAAASASASAASVGGRASSWTRSLSDVENALVLRNAVAFVIADHGELASAHVAQSEWANSIGAPDGEGSAGVALGEEEIVLDVRSVAESALGVLSVVETALDAQSVVGSALGVRIPRGSSCGARCV